MQKSFDSFQPPGGDITFPGNELIDLNRAALVQVGTNQHGEANRHGAEEMEGCGWIGVALPTMGCADFLGKTYCVGFVGNGLAPYPKPGLHGQALMQGGSGGSDPFLDPATHIAADADFERDGAGQPIRGTAQAIKVEVPFFQKDGNGVQDMPRQ